MVAGDGGTRACGRAGQVIIVDGQCSIPARWSFFGHCRIVVGRLVGGRAITGEPDEAQAQHMCLRDLERAKGFEPSTLTLAT